MIMTMGIDVVAHHQDKRAPVHRAITWSARSLRPLIFQVVEDLG